MDLQTSHLAAALMSGPSYASPSTETTATAPVPPSSISEEVKMEKPVEVQTEPPHEEKEEAASGEDFTDEV